MDYTGQDSNYYANQNVKGANKMKKTIIFAVSERLPEQDNFETFACFSTYEQAKACQQKYESRYQDYEYRIDTFTLDEMPVAI